MCEKRNRTVHDEWQFDETQILRVTRAVKMPMNSEQVRQLVYETITPVEVGEIDEIIEDTNGCFNGHNHHGFTISQ